MKFTISADKEKAEFKSIYGPDAFIILLLLVGFGVPLLAIFIPDFAQASQWLHYVLWPPLIGILGLAIWISNGYIRVVATKSQISITRGLKRWVLPTDAVKKAYVERGVIRQPRSGEFPFFRFTLEVSLEDDAKRSIEEGSCTVIERDYEIEEKRDNHADQFQPLVAYIMAFKDGVGD